MSDFGERLRRKYEEEAKRAHNAELEDALKDMFLEQMNADGARRARIGVQLAGALRTARASYDHTLDGAGVWKLHARTEQAIFDEHGWGGEWRRRYEMTALAASGAVCKLVVGGVEVGKPNDPIPRALEVPQRRALGWLDVLGPLDMTEEIEVQMLDLAARHHVDPATFA